MSGVVELVLACGSWQEAQKIADALLEQKLVACVEFLEVQSKFRWQDAVEQANEIKLIMTTVEKHFDTVEAVVKKLHGYETFVLQMLPVGKLNSDAEKWLQDVTRQ